MARTKHGHKLDSLVLQVGSSFQKTQSGFDTGSRTVKVDVAKAEALRPQNGTPDYEIRYWDDTNKIVRGNHTHMFLKDSQIVSESNGIAVMSFNFEGLILQNGQQFNPALKQPYYSPGVRTVSDQLDGVNLEIFLQEITKTYMASDLRALYPLNKIAFPPFEGSELSELYNKGTATPLRRPDWHGWTITNRTYRMAGVLGKLAVFEVNDTYSEHALWSVA